ncbi:SdrD B-like domain-containing protein [Sorangium cellulosum]|uniref:SdrD B-like domain-containing protein n=1 Tax=Sorangium cellulosum TaxID=56 RepID=UPI003D9A8403
MKQAVIISSAALAALFAASTSAASAPDSPTPTCDVIQRGVLGDVRDAEIWSLNASYHVPDSYEVNTGYSSAYGEKRALFGFDLGSIPSGSFISSARFHVSTYSSTHQTVRVHRVLGPWSEDGVTWDNLGGIDPSAVASFESGGSAWRDIDLTGLVQDWVSGVVPNHGILLEEDLQGKTSYKSSDHPNPDNHPFIEVCYLPPSNSIGNTVWFDADADGAPDPSEPGIPGVVVDLFGDDDCDGSADGIAIATTATDATGAYRFGDLVDGCYVVSVDDATVPPGHVLTSEAGPLAVSVEGGEDETGPGFGYVAISSVGGAVWLDGDADGLYDPELGVNGVVVDLFLDDTLIDTTVTGFDPATGEPGFYLFDSLLPGTYTVAVASENFVAGGPLAGHEPTVDHDGGGDGAAVVSLAPGQDLHDAGFGYQPSCGNGVCGGDESCSTCAADCGACAPVCGDGVCGGDESCSTCAADCGTCAPACGDGVCSEGAEDCSSCASDCGVCECSSPGTASPNEWANDMGGLRVLFLTIGGRVYLNLQLVAILLRPDRGDMTYVLAKQLIAAKLNVGLGNWSTCIEASIAAADAWLRMYPVGSNVRADGSPWQSGRGILEKLEAYNYGELCAPHRDDSHCGD